MIKKFFTYGVFAFPFLVPASALAEEVPIDVDAVFTSVTSSVSSSITKVLPSAAVVLGAIMAIRIGLKVYKTVVGR